MVDFFLSTLQVIINFNNLEHKINVFSILLQLLNSIRARKFLIYKFKYFNVLSFLKHLKHDLHLLGKKDVLAYIFLYLL